MAFFLPRHIRKVVPYRTGAAAPIASPGGKLSSAARLMRNGDRFILHLQLVKMVAFWYLCAFVSQFSFPFLSPFLIRPSVRTGAPSPRGKVFFRPVGLRNSTYAAQIPCAFSAILRPIDSNGRNRGISLSPAFHKFLPARRRRYPAGAGSAGGSGAGFLPSPGRF